MHKPLIFYFAFLLIFTSTLTSTPLFANNFNITHQSSSDEIFRNFLETSYVQENLQLAIPIIDIELMRLSKKPFKLSKKQIDNLKRDLLVRYHPVEFQKTLLKNLQGMPKDNFPLFLSLTEVLDSSFAKNLFSLREKAFSANQDQSLNAYQNKLAQEQAQKHRIQIAKAYDGLQNISTIQAALYQHIQSSIYKRLDIKIQGLYKTKTDEQRFAEIHDFNVSVNLYAFKQVPADDFIKYFNELTSSGNKNALAMFLEGYEKTLSDREKLDFQLENQ